MSNIQSLVNEIGRGGYQDASRYSIVFEIGGDSSYKIPPERVIGIDLPGPKYEFINCNYWLGNQFFRMPVGLKFDEQLIIQVIIPEKHMTVKVILRARTTTVAATWKRYCLSDSQPTRVNHKQ